jgi:peptidylprolyl isomerase
MLILTLRNCGIAFGLAIILLVPRVNARQVVDPGWIEIEPENTLYISLPAGRIVIALSSTLAPLHVEQMKTLARQEFFDGLPFYRVQAFVAQAGDMSDPPRFIGTAADSLMSEFDQKLGDDISFVPLRAPDEYNEQVGFVEGFPAMRSLVDGRVWMTGCRQTVAMARDMGENSANVHFSIRLDSRRDLDRNLTVFGRVIWGMEIAASLPPAQSNNPSSWTFIDSIRVGSDVPIEDRFRLQIRDTASTMFQDYLRDRRFPNHPFYVRKPLRLDVCDYVLLAAKPIKDS